MLRQVLMQLVAASPVTTVTIAAKIAKELANFLVKVVFWGEGNLTNCHAIRVWDFPLWNLKKVAPDDILRVIFNDRQRNLLHGQRW